MQFSGTVHWEAPVSACYSPWIRGGVGGEVIGGTKDDIFDSDAGGGGALHGKGGGAIYCLGYGTDQDTIDESADRGAAGDALDGIWIKNGIDLSKVKMARSGTDLQVQLLDSNKQVADPMTVRGHFFGSKQSGKTVWKREFERGLLSPPQLDS